jgi:hypothetical protein
MGCRYEWTDPNQLIINMYIEFPWDWTEYDALGAEVYGKIKQLNRPVAITVDISKMGPIPKGNVLAHLKNVERIMPTNVFISVLIGAPYAATVFMNMFTKLRPETKKTMAFAQTIEEAEQMIHDLYDKLQEAPTQVHKPR